MFWARLGGWGVVKRRGDRVRLLRPGRSADWTACPVCVYYATDVNPDQLHGHQCWNCGDDLGTHRAVQTAAVRPGEAFAEIPSG